jgi:hypothetical protein
VTSRYRGGSAVILRGEQVAGLEDILSQAREVVDPYHGNGVLFGIMKVLLLAAKVFVPSLPAVPAIENYLIR